MRVLVVESTPFEEIVRRLTATIGHPDMNAFHSAVAAATTVADLEAVVQGAIGSSDLMEFARFDAGDVLRKGRGGQGPKILRLVVGGGKQAHKWLKLTDGDQRVVGWVGRPWGLRARVTCNVHKTLSGGAGESLRRLSTYGAR